MTARTEKLKSPASGAILLLALFVVAFWVPLKTMVATWWTNEDYSYGFLIPLISAYLLWDNRKELREIPVHNSWFVLPAVVVFLLASVYGVLGSSGNISMPSIPFVIILLTAFVFGVGIAKASLLPLGFLIFMVPIPSVLERTLGMWLKSISSQLGGAVVALLGIPVHVSGNVIDLGVSQMQVVDACSGLRYLWPLLALGVVYAYFFEESMWKRIFCVVATIPIALATNVLRIGLTGILTERYGSGVAEGFFHGFSGWVLFMVAFAFLVAIGRSLRWFPPHGSRPVGRKLREIQQGQQSESRSFTKGLLVAVLLLVMVATLSLSTKALPAIKIQGGLESFPLSFADWNGKKQSVDPEIILSSGAEEAFSANYAGGTNSPISLYIGYRSTAFLSNENFFHSPTVCLPASGWKESGRSTHVVKGVERFDAVRVTKMVIENMGNKELVYFWFQTKDEATEDKNVNRFHLALHAIKRDNTHDLFIRPITPIRKDETIEQAEARMDRFVRDMMPVLLAFLKERQYEETK
jgi:exosortase D (VPLPA-CTERM-specific)